MPSTLATTIKNIDTIPNEDNRKVVKEYLSYMKANGSSERHQNNSLKGIIYFGRFIGEGISFLNINKKEQITAFLDTKVKSIDEDPDKKWINTWNDYCRRLKTFFRWLYNLKKENKESTEEWVTPAFAKIKEKKSKRLSPYSETEIWDRDELLTIIKYEPIKRNKAALSLLWDLDARNHEVTLLKIKNIRLREKYGEGEVPHEAKTGTGPILLTLSLPYVRDWLNEHPFKNQQEARLICNIVNGAPIKPDSLWTVMKQLKRRIIRLLENNSIADKKERENLLYLLTAKKWNPYCIRHSSITADSDYLPDYALKKKVRWSMNSRQSSRYIKRRMGNELKNKILEYNGIITEDSNKKKPSVLSCPRCQLSNAFENKYCSGCVYPLKPEAYDEIKLNEDQRLKAIEEKHEKDLNQIRREMNNGFTQLIAIIQKNPVLGNIKPEILVKKEIEKSN